MKNNIKTQMNYCPQCGTKQEKKSSLILGDDLKVVKYRNGDDIPKAISDEQWIEFGEAKIGAYSIIIDEIGKSHYLYNWFAVDDKRGLAPEGWRIPTDEELNDLKLKEELRENPTYAGYRTSNSGNYGTIGSYGYYWSSTEYDSSSAWARVLFYSNSSITRDYYNKQNGFSVRCVKEKE